MKVSLGRLGTPGTENKKAKRMNARKESMKAKARENFAVLNTANAPRGIRMAISAYYAEPTGQIIHTVSFVQQRGQIYSEDWLFHATRDAAEIVAKEADGNPWAVLETMMGFMGPATCIYQAGNME